MEALLAVVARVRFLGQLDRLSTLAHELERKYRHAILHAFETGQYRRGTLIARQVPNLNRRINPLVRRLGLTVCGLNGRQEEAR